MGVAAGIAINVQKVGKCFCRSCFSWESSRKHWPRLIKCTADELMIYLSRMKLRESKKSDVLQAVHADAGKVLRNLADVLYAKRGLDLR